MTDLMKAIDKSYADAKIQVFEDNGEKLFIPKEICKVLGLSNSTDATRNIPDKWRREHKISCYFKDIKCITEPGVYRMIMRTNKPNAQRFQEWVCEDVLPTISRTGRYNMENDYIRMLEEKNRRLTEENELLKLVQNTYKKSS